MKQQELTAKNLAMQLINLSKFIKF